MPEQQEGEDVAGHVRRLTPSENSQAARTTKAGLRNSEGWMPSRSQRRAPFTSAPKQQRRDDQRNRDEEDDQRDAADRCGDRKETAIITAKAGTRNSTCRLTKWNMFEMPMRSATAGLAASSRTTADHHQAEARRARADRRSTTIR